MGRNPKWLARVPVMQHGTRSAQSVFTGLLAVRSTACKVTTQTHLRVRTAPPRHEHVGVVEESGPVLA